MYKKICKNETCGKEFEHPSRSTRYCSEVCSSEANKRRLAVNKKRKRGREVYYATQDIQKYMTNCYKVASMTAELFELEKCNCSYCRDKEEVDYELHHKDSLIWNNNPSNLIWLCKKRHHVVHAKLPVFSMVEIIRKAKGSTNMEEEVSLLVEEIIRDWENKTGENYKELMNGDELYG